MPIVFPFKQILLGQQLQHRPEHRLMCFHIDQPSRAREGRVIGSHLLQSYTHKTLQGQRIRRSPRKPALAVQPFEVPDQQQEEVPSRRQTRPS
jgi:hypothetical protein